MKQLKKPFIITLFVLVGILLLAVLAGVLNALVGGGEWSFGWSSYRYDDKGFTVGSGTVYRETLTALDVDWIDGSVEIVICDDTYPSVSERVPEDLSESMRMRVGVSEDGRTLYVKYRAPSSFFAGSGNRDKDLTVRIPRRMLSQMESLRLNVASATVHVEDIPFSSVEIRATSGDVTMMLAETAGEVNVTTASGDVCVVLGAEPSVSLSYTTAHGGAPLWDVPFRREGDRMICGEGACALSVETKSGELVLKKGAES